MQFHWLTITVTNNEGETSTYERFYNLERFLEENAAHYDELYGPNRWSVSYSSNQ